MKVPCVVKIYTDFIKSIFIEIINESISHGTTWNVLFQFKENP